MATTLDPKIVEEIAEIARQEQSILAIRALSAVACASLFYDHLLTLGKEVELIWWNRPAGIPNRLAFFTNRYVSEAMMLYVSYVLGGNSAPMDAQRRSLRWTLGIAFGVLVSLATAFGVLAAHQVQPFLLYNPIIHMCTITKKPLALSLLLGSLSVFDLFIIVLTVVNGFHRPYRKQADVMVALQRDGAMIFVCLFFLRLTSLVMSILGSPSNCFITLAYV
ncbi:hypothetical protein MKEN_00637400 [Mycena kentingensis (nom. inval.)]|nr:hypothetical protein MKEN_00637400 [Mycena kentingensis (nom. inval.)]